MNPPRADGTERTHEKESGEANARVSECVVSMCVSVCEC